MGLLELAFLGLAGLPLALMVVLARSQPVEGRPPVPWPAVLAFVLLLVPAGGLGLLLGPALHDQILPPGLVFTFGPEAERAQWACALVVAWGVAMPSLVAVVSLGLSARRSVAEALVLAAAVAAGYAAGALVGLTALAPSGLFEQVEGSLSVSTVVVATAWMLFGLGSAGATLTGVAAVASRSDASLRAMGVATVGMPALALGVSAAATPPDVVTQLLLAMPIALCWVAGLVLGAAVRWARSRLAATP